SGHRAHGQLHAERRSLAESRFYPNTTAMHLDDLLGDGQTQPRSTLCPRVRSVDLVELLKDPLLLLRWNAGPRIADAEGKVAVGRSRGNAHLAGVSELDRISDQIEQHLR